MNRPIVTLAMAATAALLPACTTLPDPQSLPPIVFVHGNGDSAALWMTTLWRFESNGWPRDRLAAVDFIDPVARDDDGVAQPGRSSSNDNAQALAAQVDALLQRTGASQLVLVGNSRGGNAIRNYIQNYGGAAKVGRVVLGGTPSHGVWASPAYLPNSEFNGAGAFLKALNAPKGPLGDEVTPGVAWLTIRSDNNDKFAQPMADGQPTNVGYDGPALKGARNAVLPGRDHREVSFHAESFALTHAFITGQPAATAGIVAAAAPVLDGRVSGYTARAPDNRPLVGATVEVYAVDAATGARRGPPQHRRTIGSDGRWGPFQAAGDVTYEFVVAASGVATTHVYRSPFARSSAVVNLRPVLDAPAGAAADARATVILSRPRGYFGLPRDRITFDGVSPPDGLAAGVATRSELTRSVEPGRTVTAEFESGALHERLAGRSWPLVDGHVTVLELTQ